MSCMFAWFSRWIILRERRSPPRSKILHFFKKRYRTRGGFVRNHYTLGSYQEFTMICSIKRDNLYIYTFNFTVIISLFEKLHNQLQFHSFCNYIYLFLVELQKLSNGRVYRSVTLHREVRRQAATRRWNQNGTYLPLINST